MKRRTFLKITLPLASSGLVGAAEESKPELSFGVIADPQYADIEPTGTRFYRNSLNKLGACVEELNKQELSFVTTLGDLIDRDLASFDAVMPIYDKLLHPHIPVCGNHDFFVADGDKAKVLGKMKLQKPYDSKSIAGWRLIFLDGMDISVLRQPSGDPATGAAQKYMAELKQKGVKQAQVWNGGIGVEQMAWLEKELDAARVAKQRVILFNHFPVFPENIHNLWNAEELVSLISKHKHVVAYMNGHLHTGNYIAHQGCHFMNFKGMVETEDQTAYAIVHCFPDRIEIQGYGLEAPRKLGKL